jgi:hypothetical protein
MGTSLLEALGGRRKEWPVRRRCQRVAEWSCETDPYGVSIFPVPVARARTLEEEAASALRTVPGVDGAFLTGTGDERTIIVAAREHGLVPRERLLEIEDRLAERFGYLEISVRAHQGRGLSVFDGLTKIF